MLYQGHSDSPSDLKNVVLMFCKCVIPRAEAGKVWALMTILLLWDGKMANSKEFDNH